VPSASTAASNEGRGVFIALSQYLRGLRTLLMIEGYS